MPPLPAAIPHRNGIVPATRVPHRTLCGASGRAHKGRTKACPQRRPTDATKTAPLGVFLPGTLQSEEQGTSLLSELCPSNPKQSQPTEVAVWTHLQRDAYRTLYNFIKSVRQHSRLCPLPTFHRFGQQPVEADRVAKCARFSSPMTRHFSVVPCARVSSRTLK